MEDQNLESQNPTGDQNGEGQAQDQQQNGQQGGPSDEFKMRRIEQENKELKERLKSIDERLKSFDQGNDGEDGNDEFAKERASYYTERASDSVTVELKEEIAKLPKPMQDKIKADPFNSAWTDPKVLEYEMYGIDRNNPKEVAEAKKRAAIKSLPEFISQFENKESENGGNSQGKTTGVNPPLSKDSSQSMKKDLFQMSDEELIRLRNARTNSTI